MSGERDIFLVDANGENKRQLTDGKQDKSENLRPVFVPK